MRITKRMKEALKFLGPSYTIKIIDLERCIYRNLNNGSDIEVSGINRPRGGHVCNFIQVWGLLHSEYPCGGYRPVEKVGAVKTLQELKAILTQLSEKYGVMPCGASPIEERFTPKQLKEVSDRKSPISGIG